MRFWAVIAALAVGVTTAAACGGQVTIKEDELDEGTGGSGQQTCGWPDPVGEVIFCGSTTSPGTCSNAFCDVNGNVYESDCTATACKCKWNTQTKCTCALNGEGDFCAGMPTTCCPSPIHL
ncbi:MAG: hypothetical protein HUU21_14930 [Polyangiaceae bacterium]|nr:hypothetical protein [Polyangiaceae bacterium]